MTDSLSSIRSMTPAELERLRKDFALLSKLALTPAPEDRDAA